MSRAALELETITLRSQLSLFQQQMLNHKISNLDQPQHFADYGL
jgi:hypothetical protein